MQGWHNDGARTAHRFDHLTSNQGVAGSSPAGIANKINILENNWNIGGLFRGLKR